jgi:hypothetical protein
MLVRQLYNQAKGKKAYLKYVGRTLFSTLLSNLLFYQGSERHSLGESFAPKVESVKNAGIFFCYNN